MKTGISFNEALFQWKTGGPEVFSASDRMPGVDRQEGKADMRRKGS